MLLEMEMKTFLVLVLSLTALFLWQRSGNQETAAHFVGDAQVAEARRACPHAKRHRVLGEAADHVEPHLAAQPKPTTEKVTTAAVTPGPVSEHNWAKHSLDRTHEVMDQVQQARRSNEQP